MSSNSSKTDNINGKKFDRVLDPIRIEIMALGFSAINISRPYSRIVNSDGFFPTLNINRSQSLASLRDRLTSQRNRPCHSVDAFVEVLERVSPKAVFCIGAPPSLCEACHILDIPIVEVLHGEGYVTVFKNWASRSRFQLPSHILSFDSLSTSTFRDFRSGLFEVIQVQKLWGRELISSLSQNQQNREHNPLYRTSNSDQVGKVVLFSLQWGYAGDHGLNTEFLGMLPNGLIPESVLEAMSLSGIEVKWLFRLHPVQMSQKYRKTRKQLESLLKTYSNAEWEEASAEPLPSLFSRVSHHITMSSMSVYQASENGIPSLMLCPTLGEGQSRASSFADLRTGELVTIREMTSIEILEWVKSKSRVMPPLDLPKTGEKIDIALKKILFSQAE
jgi:hypothetical protein